MMGIFRGAVWGCQAPPAWQPGVPTGSGEPPKAAPRWQGPPIRAVPAQCLYGCYVHSSIVPTFHRRCYWLLQVTGGSGTP